MSSALEEDALMPIAIIGIAGRFPGEASNPEKLWDMIAAGRNALTEVPKDRFNIDAFYHPHGERQGTMNVRGGNFLQGDISAFDAPFFSITPKEANAMDPQQRMALEVAYESIENAGLRMEVVVGSKTSCYMASFSKDYSGLRAHDSEDIPLYEGTGNGTAMNSNRISWFFDLNGPSLSMDTACSSSLVALNLACQSIRAGESTMSLVGGTNLMLMPEMQIAMTSLHFLSPDSKSHSFDDRANGYARGEGAAVIVIKPLHAALRDGDPIRAVIRNTGVNQDGKTPGITVPSAAAQEALIRSTYKEAGLNFTETGFFEAHGTGTPAGDPLECSAIAATFGSVREKDNPLLVGSIKTNIGHMEGVSGLAGLIKAVYALERGIIPANLWFEKPNPRIPMEEWRIKVPTELTLWPTFGLRRASVNSFGYGGTNAHCIVDDAYHYLKSRGLTGVHSTVEVGTLDTPISNSSSSAGSVDDSDESKSVSSIQSVDSDSDSEAASPKLDTTHNPPRIFAWSSSEQSGSIRTSELFLNYLRDRVSLPNEPEFLARLSITLNERRSVLPWKYYTIASSVRELIEKLEAAPPKAIRSSKVPNLLYIFTGQGAQWAQMGRELYRYSAFSDSLKTAESFLTSLGCSWSLTEELLKEEQSSLLSKPEYSQPICTALQVALVDLLASWNIKPALVAGHSSGEIAAAYAKGAIVRESAWAISFHRGVLSGTIPEGKGAMLAAGLGEEIKPYLERVTEGKIVVACVNSPMNVTLSGDTAGILQVQQLLEADKIFARTLKVQTAYHSPHMLAIADKYRDALLNVAKPKETDIPMFSSVTGKLIKGENLNSEYWVQNMVSPVQFSAAVQSALSYTPGKRRTVQKSSYANVLLEVGPHSALQGPLKQILSTQDRNASGLPYLSVLNRGKGATLTALEATGSLFQHGYPTKLSLVNDSKDSNQNLGALTDIPPHPWNRSHKYWHESAMTNAFRLRQYPRNDFFGAPSEHSNVLEPSWVNHLRVSENPWIEHHKVQSSILYPAAGMLVMAVEASCQISDKTKKIAGFQIRDVTFGTAMLIPPNAGLETKLQFRPWKMGSRANTSYWNEFSISSRDDQGVWQQHSSGLISVRYESSVNETFVNEDLVEAKRHRDEFHRVANLGLKSEDPRQIYAGMAEIGLQYGPTFMPLTYVSSGDYVAHCVLQISNTASVMPEKFEYPHIIHPATLDGLIQMMIPASTPANTPLTEAKIPTFIESAFISSKLTSTPGEKLHGYSFSKPFGFHQTIGTVVASTEEWEEPLVIIEGCRNTALTTMTEGIADNSTAATSLRKLAEKPTWNVDMKHLSSVTATDVFKRAMQTIPDADSTIVQELELAAFIYCKRVLKEFSADQATSFSPHHQLFYEYIQHQYDRAVKGELNCQQSDQDWINTTKSFEADLIRRVAEDSVDGQLLVRHGNVFSGILKGEIEPLQVLREDNLLTDYYRTAVGTDKLNPVIAEYINLSAHTNPGMKILEVGAGTGATTKVVLEALGGKGNDGSIARMQSYTFTDISTGFFESAMEDFKAWGAFMDYKVLNIEVHPERQGLELESYDMVVASNVLHATTSIATCLANCKRLLKPGGVLVLGELTTTLARVPMIFGTLPGWWLGENDNRKWGPRMTESHWNSRLLAEGFSGLDLVFRDSEKLGEANCSFMISTALPRPAFDLPKQVLIIEPSEDNQFIASLASNLNEQLSANGSLVEAIKFSELGARDVTQSTCISLLEAVDSVLDDVSDEDFVTIQKFLLQSKATFWITNGAMMECDHPETSLIAGLGRTVRHENPNASFTICDLETARTTPGDAESLTSIMVQLLRNDPESTSIDWEYAIRGGIVYVSRFSPEAALNDMIFSSTSQPPPTMEPFKQDRPLNLSIRVPGMLDTFQFEDDDEFDIPLAHDDVEIEVKATGLNFHDVMVAMGQIPDVYLGVECSGVVRRIGSGVTKYKPGDRVITFRLSCFRKLLRNPEFYFQRIPDEMTFEDAAAFPLSYSTSYHGLIDHARLQRGESVLIHGAAGGLGQAAIVLSQYIGAEIFVTVSTEAKKRFLIDTYGIEADHVFNSRDLSFAKGIKRMTGGRGVDVVLNSLAGEALRQTWHCVAPFGRFIEIGKRDVVGNTGIDMAPLMHNTTFVGVNLLSIHRVNKPLFARILDDVMKLHAKGVLKPIQPMVVMNYSQIEEGFRLMQTGKHMGKIVFRAEDSDIVPAVPRKMQPFQFRPDATYMIPGGLGGLGRSIASWMVDYGAKNILFTSRSGTADPKAKALVEELIKRGTRAKVAVCDISEASALQNVLDEATQEGFPEIRGVVTCAMQLQDAVYDNMTVEDWRVAISPKVKATRNLHDLLPKDMDFFVCLSSISGVVGNRGQANYNAGNTYQDALMHHRHAQGLKGTSLNLGIVLGVGFSVQRTEVLALIKTGSMIGIREQELLTAIQAAVAGDLPPQVMVGLSTGGLVKQGGHESPIWFADGRFSHMKLVDVQEIQAVADEGSVTVSNELAGVLTMSDAVDVICKALMRKLAKAMMIELEDLDSSKPANAYGVDSLVAVEVRAWVFKEVKSDVSVFDILSNAPLTTLAKMIAEKSNLLYHISASKEEV